MSHTLTKNKILFLICLDLFIFGYFLSIRSDYIESKQQIEIRSEIILQQANTIEEKDIEISVLQSNIEYLETENLLLVQKVVGLGFEVEELKNQETWYKVTGIATAYSPFDNQSGIEADKNPNVTSTGVRPKQGIFAVDPNRIPYGSTIIIEYADGTVEKGVAGDTGATMRNSKHYWVDVYRDTYDETLQFGKQVVNIKWKPAK